MINQRKLSIGTFLSILLTLIFSAILFYPDNLNNAISVINTVIFPFILGICIAFLLDKPVGLFERLLRFKRKRLSRAVCTIGLIIIIIGLIFLLSYPVMGSLSKSISQLIEDLPKLINRANSAINSFTDKLGLHIDLSPSLLFSSTEKADAVEMAMNFYSSASKAFSTVFIAIIAAVYMVIYKDTLLRQLDRLTFALFDNKGYFLLVRVGMETNKVFSGYFQGKLLQCLLISIVTFIAMWTIGMPYAMLISVIMGIFNIIAFVGPVIGAIPCAVLLYIDSPMNALWFIIITLAVQFIIGQIIGPKLLGDSTGLPSFWVLFAVIAGAYLGGIMGMIVGIPVFGVIYILIKEAVNMRIKKKDSHEFESESKKVYNSEK